MQHVDYIDTNLDMSQRSSVFTEFFLAAVLSDHTAICKSEQTKMACVLLWVPGKETSVKKTLFAQ